MKRRKKKDAPAELPDRSADAKAPAPASPGPAKPPPPVDDDDEEEKTVFAVNAGSAGPPPPPARPSGAGAVHRGGAAAANNPPAPAFVEAAPVPPPLPPVVVADDDDEEEKTAFVLGSPGPLPAPPSSSAPSAQAKPVTPAVIIAADDDDEEEEKTAAFVFGAPGVPPLPAPPSGGAPAVIIAAEDDDDEEEKTAFVLGSDGSLPSPPSGPAPPSAILPAVVIAVDDDDDGDKTSFLVGEPGSPPPAPSSTPTVVDQSTPASPDDDEDKTSFLADGGAPAPASAPRASAPPADGDDEDKTTMHKGDAAPAKPAPAPPPPPADEPEVTGGTFGGHTTDGATSSSAWATGSTTGSSSTSPTTTPTTVTGGMPQAGATIAQYELIRKLGEGGMGAVFLARDIRLGRRVAIKFLHATNPELTERFVIEARATARVEHENIVSIYEVGEWGGSPYMVLQFLQGNELTKVIPRGGKSMPVPRVVEIMSPVLRALDCAHGESIVHRDLKPDNIFITDAGVTKVLDFGIAKVVQGDDKTSDGEGPVTAADLAAAGTNTNLTRHGSIMGTMPYMSPEQWGNGVSIDHTTDIWAVGIMMYKMLSGRHPLHPLKGTELMVTGFLDEPMPSLREKAPDLPDELIAVVDKCLTKDKSQRWPNALALLRALEPFQPGRYNVSRTISVEESPYAGLSAFQEKDAAKFFGRNREIAAMTQRLRECPMMAVVGSSGTGKSSFVRAGVVPALKNSGEAWDIHVVRPGRNPLMALAALLTQITNEGGAGTTTSMNIGEEIEQQQKRAERLMTEPGYLGTVMRRHARRQKKKLMLFVDQFEELYTLVEDADERLAFTSCLSAAADDPTSPMRVVVSIRSDFLDRCVEDVHFMTELSQGLFFITAPTRDGMRDSLVLPAEMAGYKFESEAIVNDMLDHLAHTNGALPLLQFTADKLWSERDPSRKMLTQSAYDSLGGVTGALAAHADQVLAQITGEHLKLARGLMLRLVTPDRTRAIVTMDDLLQLGPKVEVQRLIDQLVAARLLVVQTGGGASGATVELVHESLIHRWPQLKRWLDEGQDDAAFLEQLRTASRQWAGKGRDSGLLWRGEMVEEAKRFVRRYRGELPEVEQHFLKAVFALATRAQRIKRALLVAASIVVSLLLTAAAVALYIINESGQEAERQAVLATEAARVAEERKVQAEDAMVQAEDALAEARESAKRAAAAREGEGKALELANLSREQLAEALVDAQAAEKRAVSAAEDASRARGVAEERAREAIAARQVATAATANLQVALKEVEQRRRQAEAARVAAERKLAEQTRGGLVEVLQ